MYFKPKALKSIRASVSVECTFRISWRFMCVLKLRVNKLILVCMNTMLCGEHTSTLRFVPFKSKGLSTGFRITVGNNLQTQPSKSRTHMLPQRLQEAPCLQRSAWQICVTGVTGVDVLMYVFCCIFGYTIQTLTRTCKLQNPLVGCKLRKIERTTVVHGNVDPWE